METVNTLNLSLIKYTCRAVDTRKWPRAIRNATHISIRTLIRLAAASPRLRRLLYRFLQTRHLYGLQSSVVSRVAERAGTNAIKTGRPSGDVTSARVSTAATPTPLPPPREEINSRGTDIASSSSSIPSRARDGRSSNQANARRSSVERVSARLSPADNSATSRENQFANRSVRMCVGLTGVGSDSRSP